MKNWILVTISLLLLSGARAEPETSEVSVRRTILTASRMLSTEGFQARDSLWMGALEGFGKVGVSVFLLQGNEYCFVVGDSAKDAAAKVELRDGDGVLIAPSEVESEEPGVTLFWISPETSGRYHLVLERETEGNGGVIGVGYVYR